MGANHPAAIRAHRLSDRHPRQRIGIMRIVKKKSLPHTCGASGFVTGTNHESFASTR